MSRDSCPSHVQTDRSRKHLTEERITNALLWKNLLARTYVTPLWAGVRDGIPVAVWGGR